MNVAMLYHSLLSDWNHGNAHFLRGIATELLFRGHTVRIFEPKNSWSLMNLVKQQGIGPILEFSRTYPLLHANRYDANEMDLDRELGGADCVIVHEWNDDGFIRKIGNHRKRGAGYKLFFHDTHHRASSAPGSIASIDLSGYDGVLAFGEKLRRRYLEQGWCDRAWTWHEAADVRIFRPMEKREREGDVVWIGNWGDDERNEELREFLFEPVRALGLRARVYGVRYPRHALASMAEAGIDFGGWLPNYKVPLVFSRYPVTVHIPRGPYSRDLTGIPTIRVFEACACGIALVTSPWDDAEALFTPGKDFLVARDGGEMKRLLRELLGDQELRASLAAHARETVLSRHTCAHRVDQLLSIYAELTAASPSEARQSNPETGGAPHDHLSGKSVWIQNCQ